MSTNHMNTSPSYTAAYTAAVLIALKYNAFMYIRPVRASLVQQGDNNTAWWIVTVELPQTGDTHQWRSEGLSMETAVIEAVAQMQAQHPQDQSLPGQPKPRTVVRRKSGAPPVPAATPPRKRVIRRRS